MDTSTIPAAQKANVWAIVSTGALVFELFSGKHLLPEQLAVVEQVILMLLPLLFNAISYYKTHMVGMTNALGGRKTSY